MKLSNLVNVDRLETKMGEFAVAPAAALVDPTIHPKVGDYRRQLGARMFPLDRSDINDKIATTEYLASRKIDGEFTVLVFEGDAALTVNPGGSVRTGMPWLNEAVKLLAAAGVKKALIAGELYVNVQDRRPRVHDVVSVARNPESKEELELLQFGVFDIISLDGESIATPFVETWKTIEKIFGKGSQIHPVETREVGDAAAMDKLFEEWIEGEGAEGIVARSDTSGIVKIKPRHTLDAAVIGFTESTEDRQGMMHDLLLAVQRSDGALHVLTRVGGGFTEDLRRTMLSDLKDMIVESEYAEINGDHVAYQMVEPKWVVEISCLDIISENTRGAPINRMALDWDDTANMYRVLRRLPLVSVISPQFVRRREDKKVNPDDIRLKQVTDLVNVPLADRNAKNMVMPPSELLRREVFTKDAKGLKMVRKFLMWKTNKEKEGEEFSAYVMHYTDFSPNRKTPLNREVRVSSSREQIEQIFESFIEDNIKRGWSAYAPTGDEDPVIAEEDEKPKKTAKKKTTKKKTTKKKATTKKTATKETATKKKAAKKKSAKKPAKKKTKKKS